MKKRGWIALILAFLIFSALTIPVYASQSDSLRKFSEADKLWEILPEEVNRDELMSFLKNDSPEWTWNTVLSKIFSALTFGIKESLNLFCGLCILLIASCLFEILKSSFASSLESAFDFLFLLAAALFCFASLGNTLEMAKNALESVNAFFLACLPVTTVLLTLAGSLEFSRVQSAHLTFVLTLVSTLVTKLLFPITRILFCFSFVSGFDERCLSGLFKFLNKSVKRLCIFFFTMVSALLALRGALATAADSIAMRSVRFAAGSFIPVVGTMVGESSKTLAASFQLIKTECGILCFCVVMIVLVQPIICIFIQKTFLNLAAAVGEILQEKRCGTFFHSLSEILDLILAFMISHACYVIFTITLFLRAKGNV